MNVPWWYGAFLASAGLLVAAGGLKLLRPAPTARALASAGLPGGLRSVRVGSAAEVLVGLAAVFSGSTIFPGVTALSYLGFAGFVMLAQARGGTVSSCGCFGESDGAPTILHVVLNVAAAAVSAMATVHSHPSVGRVLVAEPVDAAVLVVLVAVCGYLAFLAMSVLPRMAPGRGWEADS